MIACYLIQTHNNPDQIYRLVRQIKTSSENALVLISHDFTNTHLDIAPLEDLSNIHLLERHKKAKRGDFSLIQPYLEAVDWLFERQYDFDWLIYLSEQDYPCQPTSEIEKFLEETKYDGFIQYWNAIAPGNPWGRSGFWRYYRQYYPLSSLVSKVVQRILRSRFIQANLLPLQPIHLSGFENLFLIKNINNDLMVGFLPKLLPFNENFICYGGSQWHTLSKSCVQHIHKVIHSNQDLLDHYKHTLIPDESLIQTILVNSNLFKLCNDHKRYVDFSQKRSDGRPRILTLQDYEQLINSKIHFARKFDLDRDTQILDLIDDKILQNCRN
jgi:Core-2/I-Branching enzyme